MTTSSGKHLEGTSHAQIVSLMYKLITSSRGSDDLSEGFDRSRNRRRDELAQNRNLKSKYHLRFMLWLIFGCAEFQQKAAFDLGCKLTLTRNQDAAVIDNAAGVADARIKNDDIHWYETHYVPFIQLQGILSKQILSKTPLDLRYIEQPVFIKDVNNQNLWIFDLGSQESMSVPVLIIIGFQQRGRPDSKNLNNDTFCRLPVVSAQTVIGTEK